MRSMCVHFGFEEEKGGTITWVELLKMQSGKACRSYKTGKGKGVIERRRQRIFYKQSIDQLWSRDRADLELVKPNYGANPFGRFISKRISIH